MKSQLVVFAFSLPRSSPQKCLPGMNLLNVFLKPSLAYRKSINISLPSWNMVLSREKKKKKLLVFKSGFPRVGSLGTSPKALGEK